MLSVVALAFSLTGLSVAVWAAISSYRSAKAAEESARTARQQLELAGHAYLSLRDLRNAALQEGTGVRFSIRNGGPGVARQVRFAATPDRCVPVLEKQGPPVLAPGETWLKEVRDEESQCDQIEFLDVASGRQLGSAKDQTGRPYGPGFCAAWLDASGERALFCAVFPHRSVAYELPAGHPEIRGLLRAYLDTWSGSGHDAPPYEELVKRAQELCNEPGAPG